MTKKQQRALRPFLDTLRKTFQDCGGQAAQSRTWPYRYLAVLIRTYLEIRQRRVGSKRLSRALGTTKQRILLQLVERTTDRKMKMRSRWCRVAWLAVKKEIQPDGIVDWIRDGGGLAGRAREAAQLSQELAAR